MIRFTLSALLALSLSVAASPHAEAKKAKAPKVVIKTSLGKIHVKLNPKKAPISVDNFVQYVEAGFFDGTIFHRVIPGFMIQGGGLTPDMKKKETRAPIKLEAGNGLSNKRGTIAMAAPVTTAWLSSAVFAKTWKNGKTHSIFSSPGRAFSKTQRICSILADRFLCVSIAPFGLPVVPDV